MAIPPRRGRVKKTQDQITPGHDEDFIDDAVFDRLHKSYKRARIDNTALKQSLIDARKERDRLQATCDSLKLVSLAAEEKLAFEAEIDLLKHEKAHIVLGVQDLLSHNDKLLKQETALNVQVAMLKSRLENVQSEHDAKVEQAAVMEAKYNKLLWAYNDYKRRLCKMVDE